MDYNHSNKTNFKSNNEDNYSRPQQNNYNGNSSNNNYSSYNKNKRFDNHEINDQNENLDSYDRGFKKDWSSNYSRGGYKNYNGNRDYNGHNSYNNYNDASKKYNNIENNSDAGYTAWNYRYNRKDMNWKNFWEEDEKLLSEHVEHSKKKEKNTKLNVFHNGKELTAETELKKFSDIGLNSKLKDNLDRMGFDAMTPIQKIVVPYLMDKKDVMGCAQTGSGKTVAFLAPIINNMLLEGPPKSDVDLQYGVSAPIALILAPTRELSEQIYKEGRKLLHKTGILAVKVYGGVPIDTQLKFVTNGCDILVATPGRLIDFIKRGIVSLKSVKFLVFDEADRMLDMGFEDQLREIIFSSDIKSKDQRINMMFSATFTPQVREIAKSFMNEFYFVTSNLDQSNNANDNIEQTFIYSDERDKVLKLHEILQKIKGSVIIFLDTKRGVDNLTYFLNQRNYNTIAIHGDKTQDRRQHAITSFSNGEVPILIATDVASRGIDFPNVPYVFNYDLPSNIDDYIHRIGRTGRCGNKGTAISFISENCRITRDLHKLLIKSKQKIPDFLESLSKNDSMGYSKDFNSYQKKPYKNFNSGVPNYSSNSNSSSGFNNQARPNNYARNNYVSVPADYFKKGENFRREPEQGKGPSEGGFNQAGSNYGNTSNFNNYNSSGMGRPTFTRGNNQI